MLPARAPPPPAANGTTTTTAGGAAAAAAVADGGDHHRLLPSSVAAESSARLLPSGRSERHRRLPCFFHIAPDGVREPYNAEDNRKIATALFRKQPSTRVADVVLPSGKVLQFEVRFGAHAVSPLMSTPPVSKMVQVNFALPHNTRVVVQSLAEPPAALQPGAEQDGGGVPAPIRKKVANLLEPNMPALDGTWHEVFCGATRTLLCASYDEQRLYTIGGSAPVLLRSWRAADGKNTSVGIVRSGHQHPTCVAVCTLDATATDTLWIGQTDGRIVEVSVDISSDGSGGSIRLICELAAHHGKPVTALLIDEPRGRLWTVGDNELQVWHIASLHSAKPNRSSKLGAPYLSATPKKGNRARATCRSCVCSTTHVRLADPEVTLKLSGDVQFLCAATPHQQIIGGGSEGVIYVWDSRTYVLLGKVPSGSASALICGIFVPGNTLKLMTFPGASSGGRSSLPEPESERVDQRGSSEALTRQLTADLPFFDAATHHPADVLWTGAANSEIRQWIFTTGGPDQSALRTNNDGSSQVLQLCRVFNVNPLVASHSSLLPTARLGECPSITHLVFCPAIMLPAGHGVLYAGTSTGLLFGYNHSTLMVTEDEDAVRVSSSLQPVPKPVRICQAHRNNVNGLIVTRVSPDAIEAGTAPWPRRPCGGAGTGERQPLHPITKLVSIGGKSGILRAWDALECVLPSCQPTTQPSATATTDASSQRGLYGASLLYDALMRVQLVSSAASTLIYLCMDEIELHNLICARIADYPYLYPYIQYLQL